jgi:pimeloyl-ACP methyl ester carboxylesterase
MRVGERSLRGVVAVLLGALVLAIAVPAIARVTGGDPYTRPQQLVDIGGRRLNLYCIGHGSPLVVLEAGLALPTSVWHLVQPRVARTTRVCAYDRAGVGFSAAAEPPRDGNSQVSDLHALLRNAGLPPPYVLVGHSFGGFYVRLYADRYPSEVAGLVLVDPTPDLPPFRTVSGAIDNFFEALLHELKQCNGTTKAACRDQVSELQAVLDGITPKEVQERQRSYGSMPLIVLTAADTMNIPQLAATPAQRAALWRLWNGMHDQMAAYSSVGVNFLIANSGHNISIDQPGAVISAIDEVVEQARAQAEARKVGTATR